MKNYIKKVEGGNYIATRYKPAFNYSEYNGFGELYQNGKWYSDVSLFADDFSDGDTVGWTAGNGGVLSVEDGKLKVTSSSATFPYAYKGIATVTGKKYKIIADLTNGVEGAELKLGTTIGGIEILRSTELNTVVEYDVIAPATTIYASLWVSVTASGQYSFFDNIAIIPLNDDGSIDISNATEVTTAQTYLPLTVEVDTQGNVLDYDKFDVPTLVEEYIVADKVKAEFSGKNACTAWVNFDGTTTPPTIRDSYNVSQVIRTATGKYDVYFEEDMDNENYSVCGTASSGTRMIVTSPDSSRTNSKAELICTYDSSLYGNNNISVQIFGGKND